MCHECADHRFGRNTLCHAHAKAHDRCHERRQIQCCDADKKQARMLRACLNSPALTGGGDANGDDGASELQSLKPSTHPGSQWRRPDWPTIAPGLAEPERQGQIPHQLQQGTELSSSSLISPLLVIGCCASGPRDRHHQPLTAAQIESWRERHQLEVINCASHTNARHAFEFRSPSTISPAL
jgi:hypothetical protein